MSDQVVFTNRLRDRGFVDQWGFLVFAFVGFAGIILAKLYDVSTQWVAVGACATMLSYALLVGRAGTGRLRADQTGDNCYYLGLIYTLASLSYAIFTFDPDNTATTIVQGFGIALVTTILGLVLRVFFNQGRPDLENTEQQVRLEFMEAAARLKSELSTVVQSTNDMSRQLGQSIQEIHSSARSAIENFASQTTENVLAVTKAATEAIDTQSKDLNARSKAHLKAMDAVVSRLERHSGALDGLSEALLAISQAAQSTREVAEAAAAAVASLPETVGVGQSSATAAADAARLASARLSIEIQKLEAGIGRIHGEFAQQIADLKAGPATVAAEAMQAIEKSAKTLAARTEATAQVYEGLRRQAEQALAATTAHNDGLERELSRSRELFTRVHSSFAEMTGMIAKSVERNS